MAGFSVSAVAAVRPAPGHWSRSCSSPYLLPHPLADEEAFITGLERILRAYPHALVVAGTDASLLAVSRHRHRLETHTSLGLPPHGVVVRSLDKHEVGRVASACGLSPPKTAVCSDVAEARRAASRFGYPVIIKPYNTVLEVEGAAVRLASDWVSDGASLARLVPRFGVPFLIQARQRGEIVSYAGVIDGGRLMASAVSRYSRTWPPDAGNAAFSESVDPPPDLRSGVLALLTELGWRGVFELELIARDGGGFSAIDFNPRVYGSLALAIAAGANIPAIWARSLLGERPTPVQARRGYRYRREDADLRNLIHHLRSRRLGAAIAVARPRTRVAHAFFMARDPAPIAAQAVLVMTSLAARFRRPSQKADASSTARSASNRPVTRPRV
jgi:predicted ATP-grasp superfamily ATP-dependent carboligase